MNFIKTERKHCTKRTQQGKKELHKNTTTEKSLCSVGHLGSEAGGLAARFDYFKPGSRPATASVNA